MLALVFKERPSHGASEFCSLVKDSFCHFPQDDVECHDYRHQKKLVTFEDDDFTCKAAANVKDATELIEAGYEYVCDMDNIKLFGKRK